MTYCTEHEVLKAKKLSQYKLKIYLGLLLGNHTNSLNVPLWFEAAH